MPLHVHVLSSLPPYSLRVGAQGVITVRDATTRHGQLGHVECQARGSWHLNSESQRLRWEHRSLTAPSTASLEWQSFVRPMELCVRCSKLHMDSDTCPVGHATLSQMERDVRNEAQ